MHRRLWEKSCLFQIFRRGAGAAVASSADVERAGLFPIVAVGGAPAVPTMARRRRLDEHVTVQARAANIRNHGKLRLDVAGLASAVVPSGWRRDRAFAFLYASGRSMGAFCRGTHGSEADVEVAGWE